MSAEATIAEFQRRQHSMLRAVRLMFVLFAAGMALGLLGGDRYGLPAIGIAASGVLFFVLTAWRRFRCPACNELPMAVVAGKRAVHLNPSNCAGCGVALSAPGSIDASAQFAGALFVAFGALVVCGGLWTMHFTTTKVAAGESVIAQVVDRVERPSGSRMIAAWRIRYRDPVSRDLRHATMDPQITGLLHWSPGAEVQVAVGRTGPWPASPWFVYGYPSILVAIGVAIAAWGMRARRG